MRHLIAALVLALCMLYSHPRLIKTCTLPNTIRSTGELIVKYQETILNHLALDEDTEVILLSFLENKNKEPKKAIFQVLGDDDEIYYIGLVFRLIDNKPEFDTYIQSKKRMVVSKALGLGKYLKSRICSNFKSQMRKNFGNFVSHMDDMMTNTKQSREIDEPAKTDITQLKGDDLKTYNLVRHYLKKSWNLNFPSAIKPHSDNKKDLKKKVLEKRRLTAQRADN